MNTSQTRFSIEKVELSRIENVDFNNLKFGKEFSDHMFVADYVNETWQSPRIQAFKSIELSPAVCVFHYGQAIFEGLKAYKTDDKRVLLFRPEANFERFNRSAERMCMAKIPKDYFIEGIKELIRTDINWVPDAPDQSLYIRPFLIANEAFLGVKPSDVFKFMIITSPTSAYYQGAVNVKIENKYSRASSGGIGAAKAAANYAASLYPAKQAKLEGYDQLVWTDAETHQYIEESGTMNLMLVSDGKLITPPLDSLTILPGITRDSLIHLAKHWNFPVEERKISVAELIDGIKSKRISELFGVGTAATIAPIASVGFEGEKYKLSDFNDWVFSNKAKNYLEALRRGRIKDEFNWTVEV